MILRLDLILWGVAAVLALAAGTWYLRPAPSGPRPPRPAPPALPPGPPASGSPPRLGPVPDPYRGPGGAGRGAGGRRDGAARGEGAGTRRASLLGSAWLPVPATGLALVALAAGLLWRLWPGQAWPGAEGAEGLALMAAGALLCGLWQESRELRRRQAGFSRAAGRVHGLALISVAALIGAAILSGGHLGGAVPALQADGWLLGLRNLSAGLGLGGWLFLAAGALYAGARYLWQRRPLRGARAALYEPGVTRDPSTWRRAHDALAGAPVGAAGAVDAAGEPDAAAAGRGAVGAAVAAPARVEVLASALEPEPAPGPAPLPASAPARADYAFRFSYPWLTAALLLSGLSSVSSYATPWRGQPAEVWLAITWLVGGAYLHAAGGWQAPKVPRAWVHVLAVLGALAALLAAWQMPALSM